MCDGGSLKYGDYVQVKCNEDGRIIEINAWYGNVTGTVVSVEEIDLEKMTNAAVTVRLADGSTKRFEIGYDTALTFTGATGATGKLALVESVGLKVGQQITVSYCPYEVNGRVRALTISD